MFASYPPMRVGAGSLPWYGRLTHMEQFLAGVVFLYLLRPSLWGQEANLGYQCLVHVTKPSGLQLHSPVFFIVIGLVGTVFVGVWEDGVVPDIVWHQLVAGQLQSGGGPEAANQVPAALMSYCCGHPTGADRGCCCHMGAQSLLAVSVSCHAPAHLVLTISKSYLPERTWQLQWWTGELVVTAIKCGPDGTCYCSFLLGWSSLLLIVSATVEFSTNHQ